MQDAVWVVQVKLDCAIVCREITLRKLVYIHIKVTAQQIIYFFIIVVALHLVGCAGHEVDVVTELCIQC